MTQPIFCSLSYGSASINSNGQYIPCCNIHTDKWPSSSPDIFNLRPSERINQENLKYIRRDLMEGKWPAACLNCKLAEEAGGKSMRLIWNEELGNHIIPMTEVIDSKDVRYLDLTFETKCNSKCMTCNANCSTFWEEEYDYIHGAPKYERKRVSIDYAAMEKLLEDFPNVVRISFIGGEPTISDYHVAYLIRLIELGRSKNIKLSYVTNLTGISDQLFKLWDNFKEVHIAMSIDGHGKVDEYIRYPFKWDKIESQVRKLMELFKKERDNHTYRFSTSLSCTVSILNLHHIPEFLRKFHDLCDEYKLENGTSLANNTGIFLNRVNHPDYMQTSLLPFEYRQRCKAEAEILLKDILAQNNYAPSMIDSIKILISMCDEKHVEDPRRIQKLKSFLQKSDKFRNRNIKDYIPEVYNYLYYG